MLGSVGSGLSEQGSLLGRDKLHKPVWTCWQNLPMNKQVGYYHGQPGVQPPYLQSYLLHLLLSSGKLFNHHTQLWQPPRRGTIMNQPQKALSTVPSTNLSFSKFFSPVKITFMLSTSLYHLKNTFKIFFHEKTLSGMRLVG